MSSASEPPLPTTVAAFAHDDRISYSKLDRKYLAVKDDGTELEFDERTRTWVAAGDENDIDEHLLDQDELLATAASPYPPGRPEPEPPASKKRKNGPSADNEASSNDAGAKARPAKKAKPPPQNTAVYVTGLPLDTTLEEVHELFSRKCGVIAEEIDSQRPRIKMYADDRGRFKGDALIVFFKPQSVEMAIMLLDDTTFRFTASGTSAGRMRVQPADSSYKKTKAEDRTTGGAAAGEGGEGDAAAKAPRQNNQSRQKIIKKAQKLESKLADWSDEEEYPAQRKVTTKWDKMVILEQMFTLEELEEDPAALLDIKEDIREECSKLGTVTNVVLFDQEPDGIVSVKFKEAEAALACVSKMHGRSFDGRVVQAFIATGKEKFKKSKKDQGDEEEDQD